MGIPLTGPTFIYDDNKSQVTNSTKPECTLKTKYTSICYHTVRESIVMGESLITHIQTHDILSDLMTKVTPGTKCRKLVGGILYDIYDNHPTQWQQDQPVTTAWSWGDWGNMLMCVVSFDWVGGSVKVSYLSRVRILCQLSSDAHPSWPPEFCVLEFSCHITSTLDNHNSI